MTSSKLHETSGSLIFRKNKEALKKAVKAQKYAHVNGRNGYKYKDKHASLSFCFIMLFSYLFQKSIWLVGFDQI